MSDKDNIEDNKFKSISVEKYAEIMSSKVFEEQKKATEDALRDNFASAILNSLIIAVHGEEEYCKSSQLCKDAYEIADNMIEARKVKSLGDGNE